VSAFPNGQEPSSIEFWNNRASIVAIGDMSVTASQQNKIYFHDASLSIGTPPGATVAASRAVFGLSWPAVDYNTVFVTDSSNPSKIKRFDVPTKILPQSDTNGFPLAACSDQVNTAPWQYAFLLVFVLGVSIRTNSLILSLSVITNQTHMFYTCGTFSPSSNGAWNFLRGELWMCPNKSDVSSSYSCIRLVNLSPDTLTGLDIVNNTIYYLKAASREIWRVEARLGATPQLFHAIVCNGCTVNSSRPQFDVPIRIRYMNDGLFYVLQYWHQTGFNSSKQGMIYRVDSAGNLVDRLMTTRTTWGITDFLWMPNNASAPFSARQVSVSSAPPAPVAQPVVPLASPVASPEASPSLPPTAGSPFAVPFANPVADAPIAAPAATAEPTASPVATSGPISAPVAPVPVAFTPHASPSSPPTKAPVASIAPSASPSVWRFNVTSPAPTQQQLSALEAPVAQLLAVSNVSIVLVSSKRFVQAVVVLDLVVPDQTTLNAILASATLQQQIISLVSIALNPATPASGTSPTGSMVPSSNSPDGSGVTNQNSGSAATGAIIGGVIGGIALIVFIIAIVIIAMRAKKAKKQKGKGKDAAKAPPPAAGAKAAGAPAESTTYAPVLSFDNNGTNSSTPNATRSRAGTMGAKWSIEKGELEFGEKIGSGNYGTVFEGEWRGAPVAIKQCSDDLNREDFYAEAQTMAQIRPHRNVCQIYGVYRDGADIHLVMELLPGGDLLDLLREGTLSVDDKLKIIADLVSGMIHLHAEKILHRDLAARNVLLTEEGDCKISDFGMSLPGSDMATKIKTQFGPIRWMAPEAIGSHEYSTKSDVYSFGVVIWEILTNGQTPLANYTTNQVAVARRDHNLTPEIPEDAPELLRDLIQRCWATDPEARPSFKSMAKLFSAYRKNRVKGRMSTRMVQSPSGDTVSGSRNYSNVMSSHSGSNLPSSGSVTPLNLSAEFLKPSNSSASIPEPTTKERSKTSAKAHWTPDGSPRTPRKRDSARNTRDSMDSARGGAAPAAAEAVEMDDLRPRSRSRSNTDMGGVIPIVFALNKKKKAKKPTTLLDGSESNSRDRSSTMGGDADGSTSSRRKKSSVAGSTEDASPLAPSSARSQHSRKAGSSKAAESSEDPAASTGSKRSSKSARSTKSKKSRRDSTADSNSHDL
jgi:serine/threonine protein kinase